MQPSTITLPISLPKNIVKYINVEAKRNDLSESEFISKIIIRKMAFDDLDEFSELAAKRAKKVGIKTLQDAVKIIREIRGT